MLSQPNHLNGAGIRVIATLAVANEQRASFLKVVRKLIAASRQEPGCLEYTLVASPSRPQQFVIVELWRDEQSLQVHEQSPHFQKYVPQLTPMLLQPAQVEKYQTLF